MFPTRPTAAVLTVLLWLAVLPSLVVAQSAQPCGEDDGFSRLDFWVGEWEVFVGNQLVGRNRIEKILSGCAVMEHWVDSQGSEGKSLFFYTPATSTWKQVWVTESATATGGVKEKTLIEEFADGGVRFQGEITLPDGGTYFDRTTLTPLEDGTVRQVIETSPDGIDWSGGSFVGVYERMGSGEDEV